MIGMRGFAVMLCAAGIAACSAEELRSGPVADAALRDAEVAARSLAVAPARSLRGGAVLTLEELDGLAPVASQASAASVAVAPLPPLPPELAHALERAPDGFLDPLDALDIAFEGRPGAELERVLGGTSVVEDAMLGSSDPLPAAPAEPLH